MLFKVYKKNGTKKLFYIFMAAVLFLGTVNSTVISAFAATYQLQVSGSKTIVYDGKEYTITVTALVTVEEQNSGDAGDSTEETTTTSEEESSTKEEVTTDKIEESTTGQPEEPTTGQPEESTTGQPEEPTTGQPEEPTTGQPEEPTTGGEDTDDTADYDRVSVHDPSIVKDPDTGMYYIFGSHMAWAKSDDLINWTTFTNNINTDYLTLFAKEAEWSALGSDSYDLSGNLWAPDVIWNEEMGKWCMYMSVNGDNWYTSIVLLTSDSLEGDWEYVGPVVYSGFTNAEEAAKTDLAKVIGTNEVPDRYLENRNGNHTYGMNAIDPCVKYDEDGNLWMTYGSWFGGIYMLKLDSSTGLRDYTYT